jgi:hypothetical protein
MDIPDFLLQHEIEIEPYLGVTGSGADSFGPTVTVPCFVDEKVRRVIAPTGEEAVSGATAYAALDTTAPGGSRVTLPSGRVGRVIAALRRNGGDLPVPSHLEIIIGGA